MKENSIKTMRYARLVNLGNYENERFDIEVDVINGDYRKAVIEAKDTIVHILAMGEIIDEEKTAESNRERQIKNLRDRIPLIRDDIEAFTRGLAKAEAELKELTGDEDVPSEI